MPTKRRKIVPQLISINADAVAAWVAGDKAVCHAALDIQPWDFSPFHVDSAEPPAWLREMRGTDLIADEDNWARAWRLRQMLITAAGQ